MQGGIVAGTEEIVKQLTLDAPAAKARVAAAEKHGSKTVHISLFAILFVLFFVFSILGRIFHGARRTRGGGFGSNAWWLLPLILSSSNRGRGGWGGGSSGWGGGGSWGGGGGGGGFSGGGGSFGGGGASGHW